MLTTRFATATSAAAFAESAPAASLQRFLTAAGLGFAVLAAATLAGTAALYACLVDFDAVARAGRWWPIGLISLAVAQLAMNRLADGEQSVFRTVAAVFGWIVAHVVGLATLASAAAAAVPDLLAQIIVVAPFATLGLSLAVVTFRPDAIRASAVRVAAVLSVGVVLAMTLSGPTLGLAVATGVVALWVAVTFATVASTTRRVRVDRPLDASLALWTASVECFVGSACCLARRIPSA